MKKIIYSIEEINFAPNEIIYSQGEKTMPSIYLLQSGNVKFFTGSNKDIVSFFFLYFPFIKEFKILLKKTIFIIKGNIIYFIFSFQNFILYLKLFFF